ncbi:MAG: hypothetical protein ACPGYT_15450, partial [Nitrospirales bacterium]
MSVYKMAIDATTRTIDRRAFYYRNLIVVVVAISLCSIGWSLITWQWVPLLGCLLLFPICGLYFFLDGQLLQRWRSQLLEPWSLKEVDLLAFKPAIEAVPSLPSGSLQSMLMTLPWSDELLVEHQLSASTRQAVVLVVNLLHSCRAALIVSKTLVVFIIVASLILVVILWEWEPLLGLVLGVVFGLFRFFWQNRQVEIARAQLGSLFLVADFSDKAFRKTLTKLSRTPLSL